MLEPKPKIEAWRKNDESGDQESKQELKDLARADEDGFAIAQPEEVMAISEKRKKTGHENHQS